MMKPVLNVALFGYAFMGRAHSNAYRQVGRFFDCPFEVVPKVLVGRTPGPLAEAAARLGWQETDTDADRVLERADIHLVDIATPNDSHHALALKALEAGKMVAVEKPMALTVAQAREMSDLAERLARPTMVWHNYRRCPAAMTAAALVRDGRLGRIQQVRAVYLQDWLTDDRCPWLWRMDARVCGSGAHGDLNAHLIDMTRFLTGIEFDEVVAMQQTFIRRRRKPGGTEMGDVDVDDAFLFLARLDNGATASFEASRVAAGRKNRHCIEINGTRGSLVWDLERMNELEFFSFDDEPRTQGFRRILCMNNDAHPWARNYWPDGHIIGYEHTFINALYDFLVSVHAGTSFRPDFRDGVANQEVLEAAQESIARRAWVAVAKSRRFEGPAPVVRP